MDTPRANSPLSLVAIVLSSASLAWQGYTLYRQTTGVTHFNSLEAGFIQTHQVTVGGEFGGESYDQVSAVMIHSDRDNAAITVTNGGAKAVIGNLYWKDEDDDGLHCSPPIFALLSDGDTLDWIGRPVEYLKEGQKIEWSGHLRYSVEDTEDYRPSPQ